MPKGKTEVNKNKTKPFALWKLTTKSKSSMEYHKQADTFMTYVWRDGGQVQLLCIRVQWVGFGILKDSWTALGLCQRTRRRGGGFLARVCPRLVPSPTMKSCCARERDGEVISVLDVENCSLKKKKKCKPACPSSYLSQSESQEALSSNLLM